MSNQFDKRSFVQFLESSFIHAPKRKPLHRLQLGGMDKTANKIKTAH